MRLRWLALLPLMLSTAAADGTLLLRDHSAKSLSSTASSQQLTAEGVGATLSTLAGSSLLAIDQSAAAQVSALLPEGLVMRPEAVLSVHIVGADAGHAELTGWAKHGVAKCCNTKRVAQFLAWASPHSPSLHCGEQCVEQGLQALASLAGAKYSPTQLSLPVAGGAPVELDMSGAEERVWAAELAAALNEAQAAAGGSRRQYAWTLVGLQALALKHGTSTPQVQAAQAATLAAVVRIDELLAAGHADSLVSIVVLSPVAELPQPSSLASLLRWKEAHQQERASARVLMEDPALGATMLSQDNSTSVHDMTVKTSAWVAGIMLLVFLVGALCCMCKMDFKKDSLLFGVQKTRTD